MDPSERHTCEELLQQPYFDKKRFSGVIERQNEEQRRRERREKREREKNASRMQVK